MDPIFTIPSDFNIETLNKIVSENKKNKVKILEVYGSNSESIYGSGRKNNILPKVTFETIKEYVEACKKNNITFNYVFNFNCIDNDEFRLEGKQKIINEVKKYVDIGINDFTIANPAIIEIIDNNFSNINITVSVITGIDDIDKLKYFCEFKNVKNIYIHEKMYRQIKTLSNMVKIAHKYEKKIGIIINSACLSSCPFRQYHYNYCSHSKKTDTDLIPEYYCTKCKIEKLKDKRKILKMPWVRPEDFWMYNDIGIDRFKISGRELAEQLDCLKMMNIYNLGGYDGNIMDLLKGFTNCYYTNMYYIKNDINIENYLKNVFEGNLECSKNQCDDCMKCNKALESIIINKENKEKFIKKYDDLIKKYKS